MRPLSNAVICLSIGAAIASPQPSESQHRTNPLSATMKKVKPGLVLVQGPSAAAKDRPPVTAGAIVNAKGLVLAPHHVLENGDKITVTLDDGTKVAARLLLTDPKMGIAAFEFDGAKRPHLSLADSDPTKVGDTVIHFGCFLSDSSFNVSVAVVSATDRQVAGGDRMLQIDSSIGPGVSSGVLVDERGSLLGIDPHRERQGISISVPSNRLKEFVMKAAAKDES